jgi:hypothetical protein
MSGTWSPIIPNAYSEEATMGHCYHHALSSVKKWGGSAEDYLSLHQWFDESKAITADFRHRALRHHAEGIFMLERSPSKFKLCPQLMGGRTPVWHRRPPLIDFSCDRSQHPVLAIGRAGHSLDSSQGSTLAL